MKQHIVSALRGARSALDALLDSDHSLENVQRAALTLIQAIENRNRIFSCGNGGSMCDAMHFAEEMTGRFRQNRRPFPAVAISDPGHLSCVGNDYGYDEVFARYIEANARKGDVFLALSTSGESKNVVRAIERAKAMGVHTLVLTGKSGSTLEKGADICICTPAGAFADRAQELHIKILHIFIELVERHFCPEQYNDAAIGQ